MGFLRRLFPYPFRIHRLVEVLSLGLFLLFAVLSFWKFGRVSLIHFKDSYSILIFVGIAIFLAAYICADFISGFVHFLGDSFGDENTPYVGPAFIFPFRDHHVDPKGITRHDFVETNGNNCLVSLPILLYCFFVPIQSDTFPWGRIFWLLVLVGIFFTNQIHKWAHQDSPNRFVRFLQNRRLILSPEHHGIHHTKPYDTFFCITTGWWNSLLHRIRFFPFVKRVLKGIFRPFTG
ncbi:kua-ubiquitin conjugating enzyme hybrid localization domain protein [Leptospira wolffii]|uniref:fatty acid desaturase CarF family protein n=1 Tax=Leptospira wolffii TaxID=409998 RepID=UPI0010829781|nr:fatty acid desaturase CarF family protein [Leptospira wolffii]TGK61612.1 kua-ubiquitin conjugating enzyme hybrid localization domain protein [Leptospira wolffii]TGK70156.1 kua-ubiquitin conjugating enzyme hybrid localization domain protein [Leptospira wolffii]TGK77079.1 kua-ubiquitin conjugating enzyme hybrid localization domain protein [Leptospira wolffii]TGL31069.1 kua-ubiquitin conjugating enzyme hybrid localization domain protein [Leptospira wolffii]